MHVKNEEGLRALSSWSRGNFENVSLQSLLTHERNPIMPIYEFVCVECHLGRDVILDRSIEREMEFLCVHCGGVMKAAQVSKFSIISSSPVRDRPRALSHGAKSCGHAHACRCAVKMTKPNPFQEQIDSALGNAKSE
jgi:hypothetical protein